MPSGMFNHDLSNTDAQNISRKEGQTKQNNIKIHKKQITLQGLQNFHFSTSNPIYIFGFNTKI